MLIAKTNPTSLSARCDMNVSLCVMIDENHVKFFSHSVVRRIRRIHFAPADAAEFFQENGKELSHSLYYLKPSLKSHCKSLLVQSANMLIRVTINGNHWHTKLR